MTTRELAAVVVAVAILAARFVVSWQWQMAALTGAAMIGASAWAWLAQEEHGLRSRLAGAATAFFVVGFALAIVTAVVHAPPLVCAAAVVVAAVGAVEWHRLRAAPLADAEPRGRVAFEGRVHALDGDTRTGDLLWVARRGVRRRWTSADRVELRGERGKVWIDPREARTVGTRSPHAARTADGWVALEGAAHARWWKAPEGARVFVVGTARQEPDTRAVALRDPPPVTVFAGDVVLGRGLLAVARRRARTRTLVWGAIALAAAGMAAADWSGWLS